MLAELHFLRPYWLLALFPLGALLWWSYRAQADDSGWQRVCDARFLPYLLRSRQSSGHRLWLGFLGLGWLLTVLALAGPSWSKQPQPVYSAQNARVIVLDLSRSMLAADLEPTRLTRARFKIADILARSGEGQTGLVVFAGDAFVVSPLTQDAATISALLSALDPSIMPVQGSRVDLGLNKAVELLQQAGFKQGEILVVADGINGESAFAAARRVGAEGFRVAVLAVGTPEGAPIPLPEGGFLKDAAGDIVVPRLQPEIMQRLAAAGGGRYAAYSVDSGDLDWLLQNPGAAFADNLKSTDQQATQWREQGPWLVLVLVPLAALAFRQGWVLLLLLLIMPPPGWALSWADLWQRRDQQVAEALRRGDFNRAALLAQDPMQRGIAHYRRGDYGKAAQAFAQASSADAHYNRGNALAHLNRFEEALAAYDAALAQQPDMEDAKANRALIEALLRQQPPPNNSDSSQSSQREQADPQAENNPQRGQQSAPKQSAEQRERQAAQGGSLDSPPSTQPEDDPSSQAGEKNLTQKQAAEPQTPGAGPQDGAEAQTQGQARLEEDDRQDAQQQQAMEQWLRRIPDDPGGLLRRKFLYQYQRRNQQNTATEEVW